jgi:hypothetical protein
MITQLHGVDAAFCGAASIAADLLRDPGVSARWDQPSALPKMSVGALACHLGRQMVRAAELLPVATDVAPLACVDDHYRRAAWVATTSPDDPSNDRTTDDVEAALGATALDERVTQALTTVRNLLAEGMVRDVVLIPWQGWSLRREDFLITRILEVIVHSDDLAASIGIATPEFPLDAFEPVRDLLVRLAVDRHGQSAVIATLTRRERAHVVSAF